MISQKKLLLLVSFSAAFWIIYQFIFTLPELIDAWALIQRSPWNQASQAFSKVLGEFIIQLCFYGSVALWSFNEAFEEESLTSAMESSKQNSTLAPTNQTNVTFERGAEQAKYAEIMKPLSIIFVLGSIGFLLWTIYNTFLGLYILEFNFGELITNLFLFVVLAIIGAVLWAKAEEWKEMSDNIKPTKNFRQEYEE